MKWLQNGARSQLKLFPWNCVHCHSVIRSTIIVMIERLIYSRVYKNIESILHGLQLILTNSPDADFLVKTTLLHLSYRNEHNMGYASIQNFEFETFVPHIWNHALGQFCEPQLIYTKKTTDQINEQKLPKGRKYPGFCSRSSRLEWQRLHQIRAPPEFQQPWASQLDPTLQPYAPSEPNKPITAA